EFRRQTKVGLFSVIFSGGIGVILALKGFGVWSIVAQLLVSSLCRSFLLFWVSRWRPSFTFSVQSMRNMSSFSIRLLASVVMNQVINNIYFVIIGKLFSPSQVGFYARAKSLQDVPSDTVAGIVNRISFPFFSSMQGDSKQLKNGLRKTLCLLVFIICPLMSGLAVIAHPLISVLLTEAWLPCVPFFQLLCLLGIVLPVHAVLLNVPIALGKTDLFLALEICKKALIVCSILLLWRYGIEALIIGHIIAAIFSLFMISYFSGRLISYSVRDQIKDTSLYVILSALMAFAAHCIKYFEFNKPISLLVMQCACGCFVYYILCIVFKPLAFDVCRRAVMDRWKLVKFRI
ncbi:MAG: lipopolysaccharide biosynthesis protein, partial [Bacillota bacterium]